MRPNLEALLGDLYSATRGSPSANTMTDAQEAFEAGDHRQALRLVEASREQFEKSHRKLLRRNLSEEAESGRSSKSAIIKAEHGKNKALAALAKFDEQLIPALKRLAEVNSGDTEIPPSASAMTAADVPADNGEATSAKVSSMLSRLPTTFRENFEAAGGDRQQQWDTVHWYFELKPVESQKDICANAYYLFRGKHTAIIRTSSRTLDTSAVKLRHAFTEQVLKSKSREEFLQLGRRGALYLLSPKVSPSDPLDTAAAADRRRDVDGSLTSGRRDAAVTRAFFQTLISDVDRASRVLGEFGRLHGVQVPFQIDTTVITNADRGAFRSGDDSKARSDVDVIQSMVGAAVSSARGVIQRREHEFNRIKMNIPGSQRQKMLQSFAPAKQAVQTVERALQRLIQGLDIAVHLDGPDSP